MSILISIHLLSIALESLHPEIRIESSTRRVHLCIQIVILLVVVGWPIVLVGVPFIGLLRYIVVVRVAALIPVKWWVNPL